MALRRPLQVDSSVDELQSPLQCQYCPASSYRPAGELKVGSFTLDARNSTYGRYIPVDVTCTGRAGTVTTRTGFTPVKGSR